MGIPIEEIDYSFLMHELRLLGLADRRVMFDLCFLHKLINGAIDSIELVELVCYKVPARNTRQSVVFYESNSRNNYTYYSPINRIHRLGNLTGDHTDVFADSFLKHKHDIINFLSL
jgi:hypothetical protein